MIPTIGILIAAYIVFRAALEIIHLTQDGRNAKLPTESQALLVILSRDHRVRNLRRSEPLWAVASGHLRSAIPYLKQFAFRAVLRRKRGRPVALTVYRRSSG